MGVYRIPKLYGLGQCWTRLFAWHATSWLVLGTVFLFIMADIYIYVYLTHFMQIGYENGAHLAEGTRNASRSGPFGILFSIVGAVVQALVLCLGTLFAVQDVKELQESPFPVATLFLQATNREMAIFFLVIVTVTQFGCLCNIMLAEAQLMWSMSRDKCMPYHQFWYKLHSHRRIPLRIMILQAFICAIVILPVR